MIIYRNDMPTIGQRAFPKALFMVLPESMHINAESASDNAYMKGTGIHADSALAQSLELSQALRASGHNVVLFNGDRQTPDCVFPNNVFATSEAVVQHGNPSERGRYITGVMRHPSRQLETQREDLHRFFRSVLGYQCIDIAAKMGANDCAELTGSMVIDRARNIGFCGLSSRCTAAGAKAMHEAFGLNQTYVFKLANGEYHTNVVLSSLGGRGLVLAKSGFADPDAANILANLYPDQCVWLSDTEKANFAANCIALAHDQLWMSKRAQASLSAASSKQIKALGFDIHSVDLSELEKAGGSLRCMIGEIY
jgi:hypothetical protein